jgi:hypothetical protein
MFFRFLISILIFPASFQLGGTEWTSLCSAHAVATSRNRLHFPLMKLYNKIHNHKIKSKYFKLKN